MNIFCFCFCWSVATSGVGSVATYGVVSCARVLSKFFIGNNLLLKLKTSYLALKNYSKLFKKDFFSHVFISLSKFFNSVAKLLCLLSASSNEKYPSCICLKKNNR